MGKLRLYLTYREDLKTALVSVPTSQEYLDLGVYEDVIEAAENIGFKSVTSESKKPPRFIGTSLDVIKVTFNTLADLVRFKAYVQDSYEV